MSSKKRIVVTGSEGLIGSKICEHFSDDYEVLRLDLSLGYDLTDENFVKEWFLDNHADYLVNCFALNDHVDATVNRSTLFSVTLESVSNYLNVKKKFLELNFCNKFFSL